MACWVSHVVFRLLQMLHHFIRDVLLHVTRIDMLNKTTGKDDERLMEGVHVVSDIQYIAS